MSRNPVYCITCNRRRALEPGTRYCVWCHARRARRKEAREAAKLNPGRKEPAPSKWCALCGTLPHRVVGPSCRACGLQFSVDVIIGDAWKRKPSQWAILMSGGSEE